MRVLSRHAVRNQQHPPHLDQLLLWLPQVSVRNIHFQNQVFLHASVPMNFTVPKNSPQIVLANRSSSLVKPISWVNRSASVVTRVSMFVTRVERSLARLTVRTNGVESKPQGPGKLFHHGSEPVRRELVRQAQAQVAAQPGSSRAGDFEERIRKQGSSAKWQSSPDAAIDLNRFTEQVIQTIDYRIIAERERLGRI